MLSSGFICTSQFTHLYSYFILCKSFATPCIPCTDSHFINRVIYSLYTRRVKEELPVAFSCSFTMLPGKPLENAIIPARIGFTGTVGELASEYKRDVHIAFKRQSFEHHFQGEIIQSCLNSSFYTALAVCQILC